MSGKSGSKLKGALIFLLGGVVGLSILFIFVFLNLKEMKLGIDLKSISAVLDSQPIYTFSIYAFPLLLGTIFFLFYLVSLKNLDLDEGKRNLREILNNLGQGFMVFDKEGVVQPECSMMCEHLFGELPSGKAISNVLKLEGKGKKSFLSWIKILWSGRMAFENLTKLGPKTYEKGGQYITLEYRGIFDPNSEKESLDKVICIASDKTKERKLEEQALEDRANVKMTIKIFRDKSGFLHMIQDAFQSIEDVNAELEKGEKQISREELLRKVRILKVGMSTYSVKKTTDIAHKIEGKISQIEQEGRSLTKEDIYLLKESMGKLNKSIIELKVKFQDLFGEKSFEKVNEQTDKGLKEIWSFLSDNLGDGSELLKKFTENFAQKDLGNEFLKYQKLVKDLAKEQDKKIQFKIPFESVKVYLEPYEPLIQTYIHVFRNAVDHGIETAQDREVLGKKVEATISISVTRLKDKENKIKIIVEDDGNGIDPSKIKDVAIKKNILSKEEAEKMSDHTAIQLVFHPGLSSKGQVPLTSGRGIGMDAVKYEVQQLGGTVWVESSYRKGTKVIAEVPFYEGPFIERVNMLSNLNRAV